MKGHPFREVVLFLILALGLLLPMAGLMKVQSSHLQHNHGGTHAHAGGRIHVDAYGELRLSHPAQRVMIQVGNDVVLEEENTLRTDFEVCLPADGVALQATIHWPEPVEGRPFAELLIEPANRADLVYSFWGKVGENLQRWFVEPGDIP